MEHPITAGARHAHAHTPRFTGAAPSVLVHAGDVDTLKKAARHTLPWVPPQTRLEITARGLGYQSHAALLAAMRTATPERPLALQMSTSPRCAVVRTAMDALLDDTQTGWEHEADAGERVTALLATGAVFLTHLLDVLRTGHAHTPLRWLAANSAAFHQSQRALALHRAPPDLLAHLHARGSVLDVDGVEMAPLSHATGHLAPSPVPFDTAQPGAAATAGTFGRIPLEYAVFRTHDDQPPSVAPIGWAQMGTAVLGAGTMGWENLGNSQRIALLKEHTTRWRKEYPEHADALRDLLARVPEVQGLLDIQGVIRHQVPLWENDPTAEAWDAHTRQETLLSAAQDNQTVVGFPWNGGPNLEDARILAAHWVPYAHGSDRFWIHKARDLVAVAIVVHARAAQAPTLGLVEPDMTWGWLRKEIWADTRAKPHKVLRGWQAALDLVEDSTDVPTDGATRTLLRQLINSPEKTLGSIWTTAEEVAHPTRTAA